MSQSNVNGSRGGSAPAAAHLMDIYPAVNLTVSLLYTYTQSTHNTPHWEIKADGINIKYNQINDS